ncbi:MAG: hypothetical protein ABI193_00065 [Minicystis sp.]
MHVAARLTVVVSSILVFAGCGDPDPFTWIVQPGERSTTLSTPRESGGELVAAGATSFSDGAGDSRGTLVRLDAGGRVLASKEYPDWFNLRVVPGPEGQLAFIGDIESTDAASLDFEVGVMNAHGEVQRSRRFGAPGIDTATGLAWTSDGGLLIAGSTDAYLDLGFGPIVPEGEDAFVLRLDAGGAPLWAHVEGGPQIQRAFQARLRDDGSTIAVGLTGDVFTPSGFVLALGPDGAKLWSRALPGVVPFALELDSEGRIFLAGHDQEDIAMLALDAGGEPRFRRVFPGPSFDSAASIARRPDGHLLIGGAFTEAVDFGLGPLEARGGADGFLLELDAEGAPVWQLQVSGEGAELLEGRWSGDGGIFAALAMAPPFAGDSKVSLGGAIVRPRGVNDTALLRIDR